jgi:hypothetical protein
MRDAQTFLDASKAANDALIGIQFAEIARREGMRVNKLQMQKIDKGVTLLQAILRALEAREKAEVTSPEALSVLYVLSQGRMVGGSASLRKILSDSITELKRFKQRKPSDLEETENLLEIIANSTSEEATKATSKVHMFMAEAR